MSSDPYVECPADCDDGRTYGLATVAGSAATSPPEGWSDCARCDGTGRVHVDTLTNDEWSRLS